MKTSGELKEEAKRMLRGRWKEAVLMNLVPVLINLIIAAIFLIPVILFFRSDPDIVINGNWNFSMNGDASGGSTTGSAGGGLITAFFTVAISWTFLDVLREQKQRIEPLKDALRTFHSPYALAVVVIYFLNAIFTFLWSLLFIIPGIVKSYAYSQAYYIYYDTYQTTGQTPGYLDTITASRRIMDGHKGQLFWLDLSFIGWHMLAILTFGIGYLWLTPYISATKAAFYEELPKE